jgi:serine/threonine protein kinase
MIGTQIGQLTITRKLGEGGMGAVYLAQHHILETLWVVKVLLPKWSQDGTMVQRFINEAKAASSIAHASIIEVGDCGQLADGTWYIVMKYLDGGTLDRFLKSQGGPISMHLALQIVVPVADGLEAAHARDIIHCDLKPENIYLVHRGANPHHPVILDFGIARMSEEVSGLHTAPGMIANFNGWSEIFR